MKKDPFLVFVASSFGEGEPTDNAKDFYNWLMLQTKASYPLHSTQYAIFGLGNSTYGCNRYQAVSRSLDKKLSELGAKNVCERGEGDDRTLEDDFEKWRSIFWPAIESSASKQAATIEAPATPSQLIFHTAKLPHQPGEFKVKKSFEFVKSEFVSPIFPLEKHFFLAIRNKLSIFQSSNFQDFYKARSARNDIVDIAHPVDAAVLYTRELCHGGTRSCKHMEIDLTYNKSVHYQVGDHIGIYPLNDSKLVKGIADRFGKKMKVKTHYNYFFICLTFVDQV